MGIRSARLVLALTLLASLGECGTVKAQDLPGEFIPCSPFYFTVGMTYLKRQHLHPTVVSVLDPGTKVSSTEGVLVPVNGQDGTGEPESTPKTALIPANATITTTVFTDTGNLPPIGSSTFGDFSLVHPTYSNGLVATLGYHIGEGAVELSGYYLSRKSASAVVASEQLPTTTSVSAATLNITRRALDRVFETDNDNDIVINSIGSPQATTTSVPSVNRLNIPFTNAPAGFTGNNGLWLQADRVLLKLENTIGNIEANYRPGEGDLGIEGMLLSPLAGFRYVDVHERFSILTIDDPIATPTTMADYRVQTHNRIFAPQIGLDWHYLVVPPVLSFGATAKAALGLNSINRTVTLERGDGFLGFNTTHYHEGLGQIYELGATVNIHVTPNVTLTAGYTSLWLLGVAQASDQVDYDLSQTGGRAKNNSYMHYTGPTFEVAITF
jgi:hypothetical protein